MLYVLETIGLFLLLYVLFYGIRHVVFMLKSQSKLHDAVSNGIVIRGKKYHVTANKYEEYVLTAFDGSDTFTMSARHLYDCLKHGNW